MPKKTYINGFRRMVVVLLVVGWWVQNSGRVFCEYTLGLFGDRLKVWREGRAVYRSALPPQSCASRSVACVPRFKAWSRTACLQMINKRQPWSWQGKNGVYPIVARRYAHQWTATLRRSYPFQPKDFCLVILNLRPQIVLNCGLSWFSGVCHGCWLG